MDQEFKVVKSRGQKKSEMRERRQKAKAQVPWYAPAPKKYNDKFIQIIRNSKVKRISREAYESDSNKLTPVTYSAWENHQVMVCISLIFVFELKSNLENDSRYPHHQKSYVEQEFDLTNLLNQWLDRVTENKGNIYNKKVQHEFRRALRLCLANRNKSFHSGHVFLSEKIDVYISAVIFVGKMIGAPNIVGLLTDLLHRSNYELMTENFPQVPFDPKHPDLKIISSQTSSVSILARSAGLAIPSYRRAPPLSSTLQKNYYFNSKGI